MESTRTIVCKLDPTPEQLADIEATLKAFAGACDFAAETARAIGSTNKVKVQHACYREIRQKFGLSANLAIRAIARACAALKVPAKMHSKFQPTSVDYDARIFAFQEWNWTFGLTLLSGRVKLATVLGDRQRSMLKGRKPTSAVLVQRRDGGYFLHVVITEEVPDPPQPADFIGVDLGTINLATDSDGKFHTGEDVEKVRKKHKLQRGRLQRRNTKGSKKKIRRVRDKEAHFRRHENHCISKKIVDTAKDTGRGIAMEDLQGIGDRITARGGDARNKLKGWAFFQLREFVTDKAKRAGVLLVVVDPAYSSQTCNACGHCQRSHRKSQSEFQCKACSHEAHADVNAARNHRAQAVRNAALELGNHPGNRVA